MTKNANPAGIWAFNVYIRGVPTVVTIDDWLPTFRKKAIFGQISTDGSLWPALMEKLYAKVNGNYENIEAGFHAEAMRFLLSIPTTFTYLSYLNETTLY